MQGSSKPPAACSALAPVPERAVLDARQAEDLARLFDVLGSATRLRLLHALTRLDDPCMGALAAAVGMKPQAVSNQLRRLADQEVLATRRHGNHVHYRIVDDRIRQLLGQGIRLSGPDSQGGPACG